MVEPRVVITVPCNISISLTVLCVLCVALIVAALSQLYSSVSSTRELPLFHRKACLCNQTLQYFTVLYGSLSCGLILDEPRTIADVEGCSSLTQQKAFRG